MGFIMVNIFGSIFFFSFFRLFSVEGVIISEHYCKIILVRHQRLMRIFQLYIFIVSVLTYLYIYSTTCIRTHVRWVIRPLIWLVVWIRSHVRWVIRPVIWLVAWIRSHVRWVIRPVIWLVVWIRSHVRWVVMTCVLIGGLDWVTC